jgi:hypothetical protein
MVENFAAACGMGCPSAPGTFSWGPGTVRHGGAPTGIAASARAAQWTSAPVVAGPVFAVAVRERVIAGLLSITPAGPTTARKHHTYMTLAIANGGGARGPHRWREPV